MSSKNKDSQKTKSSKNDQRDSLSRSESNGQQPPIAQPTAVDPYPYDKKMKRKDYEQSLVKLQIELSKVQNWVKETGQKIVILFEGRDAAGKGGTIKRFIQHLNPRMTRVVALAKPTDTERGQWYFQRYVAHLPTKGEIVFFDRSWYNRAGVEPVMGFCKPEDYQRFIHQVSNFERGIIESGIRLFKLWFDVGREEQQRRIESREQDPLKRWKISPMDYESMKRWDDYTKARDGMFLYTDTEDAPWTVIRSDDKKRARLSAMLTVLNRLPYEGKDNGIVLPPDPLITGSAAEMFPLEGRFMFKEV